MEALGQTANRKTSQWSGNTAFLSCLFRVRGSAAEAAGTKGDYIRASQGPVHFLGGGSV